MSDEPSSDDAPEDAARPEYEARRVILARRRRFVAVALASAGVATSSCDTNPAVCLKQALPADSAEPMPCLSPVEVPDPEDAGTPDPEDAGSDADDPDGGDAGTSPHDEGKDADAGPPPRPCLKPKPPPRPCLSPPRPQPCLTPKKVDPDDPLGGL